MLKKKNVFFLTHWLTKSKSTAFAFNMCCLLSTCVESKQYNTFMAYVICWYFNYSNSHKSKNRWHITDFLQLSVPSLHSSNVLGGLKLFPLVPRSYNALAPPRSRDNDCWANPGWGLEKANGATTERVVLCRWCVVASLCSVQTRDTSSVWTAA